MCQNQDTGPACLLYKQKDKSSYTIKIQIFKHYSSTYTLCTDKCFNIIAEGSGTIIDGSGTMLEGSATMEDRFGTMEDGSRMIEDISGSMESISVESTKVSIAMEANSGNLITGATSVQNRSIEGN